MHLRSRWSRPLALFLLLLAPGAGGSALELVHVCPDGGGGRAMAMPMPGHASGSHHSDRQGPMGGSCCACIGACCPAVLLPAAPDAGARLEPVVVTLLPDPPSPRTPVLLTRPSRLLPPSTAPPASAT